ncbi:XdhC family protein [soil metagenome]
MKELKAILKVHEQVLAENKKAALATIVWVEGSAYRRPGARMLVTEAGEVTGSISGGCLETDAIRKARHVLQTGQPQLVTYDTLDDDDTTHGVGLGCNGVVQVLIQPYFGGEAATQANWLRQVAYGREPAVLATVFQAEDASPTRAGDYLLLQNDQVLAGTLEAGSSLADRLRADARQVGAEGRSVSLRYPAEAGETAVFLEVLKPSPALGIVGAGNDAMPLVRMGKEMGWHLTVVDGRPGYATRARFPEADAVVVARPGEITQHVTIREDTLVVLMTHNYNFDLALLQVLAPFRPRYLGMLGPKKRTVRMFGELIAEGFPLDEAFTDRLHSPVGLDLGAETPEEIALAIVAEIQKTLSGRSGDPLRERQVPIHAEGEG